MTRADKCFITKAVKKNRREPFRSIGNRIGFGKTAVHDYAASQGFSRCVAKRVVFLKPEQKAARLSWAETSGDRERWDDVVWTDECYVYLDSSHGKVFVTRRPDEKYDEDCVVPTEGIDDIFRVQVDSS